MNLAVLIPVCNEAPTLEALTDAIIQHTRGHQLRILFIDDGSTDDSFAVLTALFEQHSCVEVIKFHRNYGKTCALATGFARLDEDVVITMDADLQDDPKEIPRLLERLDEGFGLVCGWKARRHDPLHKTFPSRIYNRFIADLFGVPLHDVNTGFKAMRGDLTRRLVLFADLHRLIPVLAHLEGFAVTEIAVEHHPRRFGQSKYGLERFYQGLRDAARVWFAYHLRGGLRRPAGARSAEIDTELIHPGSTVAE